jgi:hypothetical protein
VEFSDSVRILASGFMHLRVLPERLEYLYGILPTTPFSNLSIARTMAEILKHESSHDTVLGSEKASALRALRDYLVAEELKLRAHLPLLPVGENGAVYFLKKVSECLHHFKTGDRVLTGPDSLDL